MEDVVVVAEEDSADVEAVVIGVDAVDLVEAAVAEDSVVVAVEAVVPLDVVVEGQVDVAVVVVAGVELRLSSSSHIATRECLSHAERRMPW